MILRVVKNWRVAGLVYHTKQKQKAELKINEWAERNNIDYNLRPRNHDRQLMRKSTYINNSLFIVRMLYKDSYW